MVFSYTYDDAGNILTAKKGSTTYTYEYTNADWGDLLTKYNGTTISYDAIGNPLSYYNGWSFTWQQGREMATATKSGQSLSFTYDADGVRRTKTVNGVTHTYYYVGGKLARETYGSNVLDFFYDQNGHPFMMVYNGAVYYYVTNAQGDVIRVTNVNGETAARYQYDPYGNIIDSAGSHVDINPLRYRGYYYDKESGLYYLQSRYYDPNIGRFINADDPANLGADGTLLSYNLFAYCVNNPINRTDAGGNWSGWATAGLVVGAALCIAAITVLTCGIGTATLAGAVAVGAAKGALIGAAVGTAAGAGIGYGITGTIEGAAAGAAIGFGAGAVVGAAVGGSVGANSWYNARALEFTNAGSNEVVLGRSGTYEQVAQSRGSTYFNTSQARWDEVHNMFGVGDRGMWRINRTFLDQQIAAGRSFVTANNPITDRGYYFAKEMAYLVAKGVGYSVL